MQPVDYVSYVLSSSNVQLFHGDMVNIQSTLVISKSKELSGILRDIRISTYQICRIEEKRQIKQPRFTNEYVI